MAAPLSLLVSFALLAASPYEAPPPGESPPPGVQEEGEPEREPELPHWKGTVSAGLTLTAGNSETFAWAFAADAVRRDENDRWTLKFFWTYAEQATEEERASGEVTEVDVLTERTVGGSAQYDWFPGERWYLLGKAGAEADELAELDLRYWFGGGGGYQFLEEDDLALSAETALVWFAEEFEDGSEDDFLALNLGYDLDWQISESAAFEQDLEAFSALADPVDDLFVKLDTRLKTTVSTSLVATLQHVLDFDHTPADGADQTDHRIVFTLGWSFG